MKQILLKFRLILTIKTGTNSPTTFDKNEVRSGRVRWDQRSWESNNLENMWYMELRVKTKYVLGLPGGTQIVLEHGKK